MPYLAILSSLRAPISLFGALRSDIWEPNMAGGASSPLAGNQGMGPSEPLVLRSAQSAQMGPWGHFWSPWAPRGPGGGYIPRRAGLYGPSEGPWEPPGAHIWPFGAPEAPRCSQGPIRATSLR